MSNKLPEQFINEVFMKRLDQMKLDPDQTIPEDFDITLVDDDRTFTDEDKKTLQFFE
jgi:hypothetical protein